MAWLYLGLAFCLTLSGTGAQNFLLPQLQGFQPQPYAAFQPYQAYQPFLPFQALPQQVEQPSVGYQPQQNNNYDDAYTRNQRNPRDTNLPTKSQVQGIPEGISVYSAREELLALVKKTGGAISNDINSITDVKYYTEGAYCDTEGALVANPSDCASFLVCNHQKFLAFPCAAGLHFDDKIKACNTHEAAQCQPGVGTIQGPGSLSPVISIPDGPTTQRTTTSDGQYNPGQWEWKPPVSTTTETTFTQTSDVAEPLKGDFKVVCYFTNWAWYRPGIGKYRPEDIDPTLCTHVVYGFAVLDGSRLVMKPHDTWADIDNEFYTKVTALKKKGIKVTIAIGGWNDSLGGKYSQLVSSPSSRARFIEEVMRFIEKYNFDGLDLDWEYPKCWQVECNQGPDSDKENFASLVRELRAAFNPKGYLLSAAVSPSKTVMDLAYDVPSLARDLDWIAVMSYDYHGHWDKKTGHVSPMHAHPDDDYDYFNTDFTMKYWMELGAPASKIVMGMPLYGQAFTLDNPSNNSLNAPASQKGNQGEFTRQAGFLAYYEICDMVKNQGWNVIKDAENRMGPYAYKDRQWVSFDDVAMIQYKSEYIRKMGLGGGMVWALDLDDFKNRCGQGHHPLMNTIKRILGPSITSAESAARSASYVKSSLLAGYKSFPEEVEKKSPSGRVEYDLPVEPVLTQPWFQHPALTMLGKK